MAIQEDIMRHALSALVVSLALCVAVFSVASAATAITVGKTSGRASDTFVFSGSGFAPDAELAAKYATPSGKEYAVADQIRADQSGAFTFNFVPASTPAGDVGHGGTWTVSFCLGFDQGCWSIPIYVEASTIY
jgi:hypothetical protein